MFLGEGGRAEFNPSSDVIPDIILDGNNAQKTIFGSLVTKTRRSG